MNLASDNTEDFSDFPYSTHKEKVPKKNIKTGKVQKPTNCKK
jgi:hypothetical protein